MIRALHIALAAWFALLSVSLPADALTPGQELPLFGKPAWVKGAANIDINFATGQSYLAGAAGPLTNSRSTPSWCLTSAGVLVAAAAFQNCVTDLGVAIFEARTESVPNNTMSGAALGVARTISGITGLSRSGTVTATLLCSTCNVASGDIVTISGASVGTYNGSWAVTGAVANNSFTFTTATSATDSATGETAAAVSPGATPTGWSISPINTAYSVVGLGTNNGYATIDLRFAGSPNSTSFINIQPMAFSAAAASYGQTWTAANWIAFVGGSQTNISTVYGAEVRAITSGGAFITNATVIKTLTGSLAQAVVSFTPPTATTAYVADVFDLGVTASQPIDITVRLGIPDLQLNPNLPASVASATVAGGGTGYVGASGTMTYSGAGCTTNTVLNVTTSAGAINAVTSVQTAGVCPAANGLPAAGSTSWTPGGGLSVGTGASFALTPTNNSANAFAHPPILTSAGAVTVNQDKISLATQPCANPSLLAIGTPSAPAGAPQQALAMMTVSGETPSLLLYRANGQSYFAAGGAFPGPNTTWNAGTSAKLSSYVNGTSMTDVFNNGAPSTGTNTALGSFNLLGIGNGPTFGTQAFNGYISRVALACGTSLLPY